MNRHLVRPHYEIAVIRQLADDYKTLGDYWGPMSSWRIWQCHRKFRI
jgi:hypothetical protein